MRAWLVAVLVAGCGDNALPCDYVEAADPSNATTAEPTGLVVGDLAKNVCGHIDNGHYDAQLHTVDVDTYRITVGGSGELLVQLVGDDGIDLLRDVTVRVFDTAANPTLYAQGTLDLALADHAAFVTQVMPGDYDVVVSAGASGDPSGPIGYRVRIAADPSRACPTASGAPSYREAHDGAGNTDNDMVAVDFTHVPEFTQGGTAPEPTALEIVAGYAYKLAGTSAIVHHADQYLDRDSFELDTADDANELAVRLDWNGATDLDFIVFERSTLAAAAIANTTGTSSEFATFAVKPSTTYWIWVGAYTGATAPTDYGVTVCGGHFFH